MDITLHRAKKQDADFVFHCLQILLGKSIYTIEEFEFYFFQLIDITNAPEFWIAKLENENVGLITANKFYMPRFLGYGFDFEEIIILPQFQRKGIGKTFILKLIEHYQKDNMCRKITIKSNDINGSCRLYKKIIDSTDFKVFQKYLNKI